MFQDKQRFREFAVSPAFVLDECSEADVAKALIESKQQREPFYIFDMDEAYRHIQRFKQRMPRVQVFFAMKANHSEMMLKLAIALGVGFDCASPGEINRILKFGVDPTSIIYAVPNKTPEQMIYARISGVKHTTFNTACELYKIKQYWPDAKLLIRIKVESDSVYKLGEKFGCLFETEAVDLLETAASLGLTVIGVAFHVGSGCSSIESYAVGIRHARALFDHEARAGRQMKILDIGGGFYREESTKFDQVSQLITDTLAHLFPDPSVQVIAEPGRYLCEAAFTLYCNINKVKTVMRNDKPLNMVYISDGINGTLRYFETWQNVYKFNIQRITWK
ncbi:ornithine decarboxylase-like isoform X2 [Trichoplusia ni]|uniref:ornithine decarboxylase n=1 Tax=Trichoplusia ni TaxID=7111 RepID=A0A7E5X2J9_TRINI|nr:ornithine decarboxylase-like isoform X2 [Trichoplusia ni]